MGDEQIQIFDADNHYYESEDAFTRHVPKHMRNRCVQWVDIGGRKHHLVGGKLDHQIANPTFNPVSKPGVLREYYTGNPEGKTATELIRSAVGPMPPEFMDRDARLERIDEQGLAGAWLFPTAGVLYEQRLKRDTKAVCTLFHAFNKWVSEDWGLNYKDRLYSAPYISLADVDWACRELEWALDNDARIVAIRPAAVFCDEGSFSSSDERFDPFWSMINEAGVTVIAHVSNSGYSTNGYPKGGTFETIGGGARPSIVSLNPERSIYDFLLTLIYDKLFERFPNVRIGSIENGSEFLPDLMRKLEQTKRRLPNYYKEDPTELFKNHVWINPFWEDDIGDVVDIMGADRVIFGSDWPHVEGLGQPREILEDIAHLPADVRHKVLYQNTMDLTARAV